jgi:hypothetical protein
VDTEVLCVINSNYGDVINRIGAISPELVCIINQQFCDIDTEAQGSVSYDEITGVHIPSLILSKRLQEQKKKREDIERIKRERVAVQVS